MKHERAGLTAAVGISLAAGALLLLSQLGDTGRDRPPEPLPAGTIVPVPLWSAPNQIDRAPSGPESPVDGPTARVYLLVPDLRQ